MNPLTNMKNVLKLSEQELDTNNKTSWHDQYKDSAWVFIGGFPYDLSEGDIICIFSQYGEIVNINLIRCKETGKSKGFCFLCYEDQRSTILAVDNLNGIKIMNRMIRVDHVSAYKVPKEDKKTDEETKKLYAEGCAPRAAVHVVKSPPRDFRETFADQIEADIKLPARLPIYPLKQEKSGEEVKIKKEKKKKRRSSSSDSSSSEEKKKKKKRRSSSSDSSNSEEKKKKKKRRSSSSDSSSSEEKKKKVRKMRKELKISKGPKHKKKHK